MATHKQTVGTTQLADFDYPWVDSEGRAEVTVEVELPDTAQEAIDVYGDEIVNEYFQSQYLRNLGNRMRTELTDGEDPEKIKERYDGVGFDPTAEPSRGGNVFRTFDRMDEDEQNETVRNMLRRLGKSEEEIEAVLAAQ